MVEYSKNEFIDTLSKRLSQYESVRKQKIKEMLKSEIFACLIFLVAGFVAFLLMKQVVHISNAVLNYLVLIVAGIFVLVAFFAFVSIFVIPGSDNKEFKQQMKSTCAKDILNVFNLTALKGTEISEMTLRESNLFAEFNEYSYDDVIEGQIVDVKYKISEIELRRVTNGKHKTDFEAFKGVVIELPSNKFVRAHTIVTTKGDLNKRNSIPKNTIYYVIGILAIPLIILIKPLIRLFSIMMELDAKLTGNHISSYTFFGGIVVQEMVLACLIFALVFYTVKRKKLKTAQLESGAFDKMFDVHTEDDVEGRYLITPSFMERMANFKTSFGTKHLKCAFFRNKVLFAIETNKDLFEVCDLYKPVGDKKLIAQFYDEITSIQNIVEYFKLNERTGL